MSIVLSKLRRTVFGGGTLAMALGFAAIAVPGAARADATTDQTRLLQGQLDSLQKQVDALHQAPALLAADGSLTWNGVTLYGTVDIGMAYQSHGAPLNEYFGPGLEYLLQKNSNKAIFSAAPNGLSQSNLGIKAVEPLGEGIDGLSAVFKLEAQFNPTSGEMADHLKAMTQNNGVALAQQSSNADSSRAGQLFQNAYLGAVTDHWGTLTVGRQNSLVLDGILAYDPMGGSQAFSIIGFSGTTGGGGDTEDTRLDSAIKYRNQIGMVRVAALGQFKGVGGTVGSAEQFGLGTDWRGLSVDAIYSYVKDAIAAAPFASLSQIPNGGSAAGSLAGTVSDNTALSLMAKYKRGPATGFAGYEHIIYGNPSSPLPAGSSDIGGYVLATVNNAAYQNDKILQVIWAGLKYEVSPDFTMTEAWYHYLQNSYAGSGVRAGCGDSSNGACSGYEDGLSIMGDYTVNRHFDVYGGAMYTHVNGGMANGYIHNNTIDPMLGVRAKF